MIHISVIESRFSSGWAQDHEAPAASYPISVSLSGCANTETAAGLMCLFRSLKRYFVPSRPLDDSRYSLLSAIAPSACEGDPNGPSCIECPHHTNHIQFRKCLDENSDNIRRIVVSRVDEVQIDHCANRRERCCLEGEAN